MITLTLLHPVKQIPIQTWNFQADESVIRIGRSTDNHVVLYSAVVSRHHVELRRLANSWEVVSLGTNGTYLDGKRITQVGVDDGAVIRLARSGPNLLIRIGPEAVQEKPSALAGDRTLSSRPQAEGSDVEVTRQPQQTDLSWRKSSHSEAQVLSAAHPCPIDR